jgi:uncharacterized membrane protein
MENTSASDGKMMAIISHFWVIGLVIAFVMNRNEKNYFASFYIRQMVGLNIISFINGAITYKYLGSTIYWVASAILFILWLISLMGAIKGEEKEIPVLGEHFQNWFRGI